MTTNEYNSYIKNYLENDKTQSAIMLTAPWGTGKSYYIRNDLSRFLEENKLSYAIVSAYGLSSRTNTNSPYAHSGSLTREQFLFFEMRTTAKLMIDGLTDEEIYERIYSENLFQFPTEKSIKLITSGCIRRLRALNNEKLVEALATRPTDEAKQICLRHTFATRALECGMDVKTLSEILEHKNTNNRGRNRDTIS